MSKDSLGLFNGKAICPSCGCIDNIGSFRCVGCGAFHSTAHLIERDVPPPEQREIIEQIVDPSFEQTDDVKSWEGGSTDFSFSDDVEVVSKEDGERVNIPKSEEL